MVTETMNIKDYADHIYSRGGYDQIFDEMLRVDGYSSDRLLAFVKSEAAREGVELTGEDTFEYDDYFWNVWKTTEKGLS